MPDRHPKFKNPPTPKRSAATGGINPSDAADRHLTWRMARADLDGGWSWLFLAPKHFAKLHSLLTEYETTPVYKLKNGQRLRPIPVADICSDAQKRLEALEQFDIDELFELRLGHGDWRVWGILDGAVLDFLWWDPDHTVLTGKDRAKSRKRLLNLRKR